MYLLLHCCKACCCSAYKANTQLSCNTNVTDIFSPQLVAAPYIGFTQNSPSCNCTLHRSLGAKPAAVANTKPTNSICTTQLYQRASAHVLWQQPDTGFTQNSPNCECCSQCSYLMLLFRYKACCYSTCKAATARQSCGGEAATSEARQG